MPQLYLISPEEIKIDSFSKELGDALNAGNIAAFQLRLPNVNDEDIIKAVEVLAPICNQNDVAFILCDDVEMAKNLNCDGVHLETNCSLTNLKAARKSLGKDAFIGVSVLNSKHNAMEAAESGADYISIGPIFHSKTKDLGPDDQLESGNPLEVIEWWARMMEVPCVAVGGLTPDNCVDVVKVGAEYIATISGVWTHPQGANAGVNAFNAAIMRASQ